MKILSLVLALLFTNLLHAQVSPNQIVGKWMKMPKEDLIIEVYSNGAGYSGKIEWSKDSTKQKGYVIIENLQFDDESDTWENGKIRDPKSGSQYKAAAKLKSDGTLEVLGYKGIKMIGSKRSFRRVK